MVYETYDSGDDDDDDDDDAAEAPTVEGSIELDSDVDEAPMEVEGSIELASDVDKAPMEEAGCDKAAMLDFDFDDGVVDALYEELTERHGSRRANMEGRARNIAAGRKCTRGTKRRGGQKQRKQQLRAQLQMGGDSAASTAGARTAIAPHRVRKLLAEL